jgi:hypothetical protein
VAKETSELKKYSAVKNQKITAAKDPTVPGAFFDFPQKKNVRKIS